MGSIWQDKVVLVGVTGGIAVYKVVELVSSLRKKGANLRVVMTENATRFVTPLTFREVANAPVYYDMWQEPTHYDMAHISLAEEADVCLVAPATANFVGKLAGGIADDLLTTTLLATEVPIAISPAMNTHMWQNPAVQDNVVKLRNRGIKVIEPDAGHLACGQTGKGRLPSVDTLLFELESLLWPQDLTGKRFLITAGPTREFADDFRFISNPSTGKMGLALAKAAKLRGADVDFILGPCDLEIPRDINVHNVSSALDMYKTAKALFLDANVLISAAAVSDFRPEQRFSGKIKREAKEDKFMLPLVKNPDVLGSLSRERDGQVLIGFAAESSEMLSNAKRKLENKALDMIVANNISGTDTGFAVDTNSVWLLGKDFEIEVGLESKDTIAQKIIDTIVEKFLR
ncbi:MAG: bifunctional phosphopantothenoylcysteine decarboxylase/phosphopantothenate--cysteine ligase CoaBC [Firmicutes bacterium]|nr:bifunctional phosphopantothenoylcysteine decarboxylase/phosphopantothenate--cysteine ligase CoaBC [Bacillota bacterium]MDD4264439.1 bifunctional phosphopantothenoylcysteine decarboxylase/phosphopantothenate--cysteine ligase CoaBC [Bacillota bacterium]MDD4694659.1 bifunctional phosphopantothenoylcysteine decarboxylase/phosphopantothenate--cysteine ligase CoaBC [Bacillota bacterium]